MAIVAAVQMCSSHNVDENLAVAERLIAEAVKHDAELIVLPEMFAIIGKQDSDKLLVKEKLGSGRIQSFLADQARRHGVWIVGGTIPIVCKETNKVRAACLVLDDVGNLAARYDKMHLFDVELSEKESYKESCSTEPGNKFGIVDTPFGRLGLAVCYDVRFPELFRYLFNQGVEIIALPSAFTQVTGQAHWEVLARSRAIENFSYLIGACQGGRHSNGRATYGHSMIVGPWGNIISQVDDIQEGVIYAKVDLKAVAEARKAIPVSRHQRIYFDLSRL